MKPLERPVGAGPAPGRKGATAALIAAGYGAANLSSLLFAHGPETFALFWPGNGFLVAVQALTGKRWHGPIAVLALAGVFLTNLAQGKAYAPSAIFAIANTAEIVLAGFLMRGIPSRAGFLAEERGVMRFFLSVTLLSSACSALIAGPAAAHYFGGEYGIHMANGFLIHAAAMAVTVPLVLAWARAEFAWERGWRRNLEFLACLALSGIYAAAIFNKGSRLWYVLGEPFIHGVFVFLVWGALRFGSRGGASVLFLDYAIAAWFTSRGHGPFAEAAIGKSLYLPMYLFPYVAAFCSLLPAAMFHGQRKIRDDLIRRDSRYGKLWGSKLIGIYVVDMQGRVHEGNDTFLDMIRRSRTDLETGKINMLEMATPEYLARVDAQRERFLRDGQIGPLERDWVLRDGTVFHSQVYACRMDEPDLNLGMVMNMEELRLAQAELRLRESRYRDLLSSDLMGIFVSDMDGKILEANGTFLRMIGRTRQELESGEIGSAAMAPPEYVSGGDARREIFRKTGRMGPYEREWVLRDGSRLHTLFFATRMQDSGNALCMVLDTGELKQAKMELRAVEARFKKLFDSEIIAVAVAGGSGAVLEANRTFLGMLGYTQADLESGAVTLERIAPSDSRPVPAGRSPGGNGRVDPHETRYVRKDGSGFPVYRVVTDLDGGQGSLVIAIDISELKRTQLELAEATRQAQAASEAKSEFLSHMSHEIRTPLNGILGMLELLTDTRLDEKQRAYIRTCNESGEHLLGLINHILDFSRIESGVFEPENARFRLREVMEGALGPLAERARNKGIAWNQMLDPETDRVFFGDPIRIRQILINLAGNAVKFTEKGSIRIRAYALDKEPGGMRVRFEVEDTGPGIAKDVAAVLFRPFRQGDASLARKAGGTGLGLAISKGLVEMLGGSIGMESEVGKGSTFRFELPLRFSGEAPAAEPAKAQGAPALRTWAGTPRILVVDDNPVNLTVARALLEKLGCDVETVGDGPGALSAAERARFDAVFMDCQMPGMDGFEATRRLRASAGPNPEAPIIALTAHVGKGFRERCLAAGMNDYVSKPFSLVNLSDALGKWTGKGAADVRVSAEGGEAASPTGPGPVDWSRLASLNEGGPAGEDLSDKLIGPFLEMSRTGLETIRQEARSGRKPELAMEIHKLRGACAMIGARSMQAVLADLEDRVERDAPGDIPELVRRLETEIARTRVALESREGHAEPEAAPAMEGKP